jgi:predicted N-acetyltransferase YhbS
VAEDRLHRPDFPTVETVDELLQYYLGLGTNSYGVIARNDREVIVGGNFVCHEGDNIWCIGPIFAVEGAPKGLGRRLMQQVIDFATKSGAVGIRLTQAGL